ncbi:MAG: hypothetical protein A3E85_03700 [Gammaproteobacteria bacterium RIFCSPHIGHO2_12_FULL_45_12]|nr:MAG: hypothetical protein A3E85_03700 [Gammaproteobacteria bacterium RIFCSPHIGHO2_12_FULL_45_12]
MTIFIKAIIVLFLVCILYSLGSALYFLVQDKGDSNRMVKALTWRISLSLLLFVFLLVGFSLGWIKPHSI